MKTFRGIDLRWNKADSIEAAEGHHEPFRQSLASDDPVHARDHLSLRMLGRRAILCHTSGTYQHRCHAFNVAPA